MIKVGLNKKIIIQTKDTKNSMFVKIIDNGIGIEIKIFDPFFTTKSIGKDIGLGLTISYQIIQKHQGNIKVVSQLNRETEVIIQLPYHVSKTVDRS